MLRKEIEKLQRTIRARRSCKVLYIKSVPVRQEFEGRIAWEGEVAIFQLQKHPTARRCYAWSLKEGSETRAVTVLELSPVSSAESAVKVAMASMRQPE
jgi:hypothetical protein